MEIKRIQSIEKDLAPKRALIIYGPRRIGKTTMTKEFFNNQKDKKSLYAVGDDTRLQKLLSSGLRKEILDWARPYEVIIIDEAQYINHVGEAIKMIIDEYPEKTIIMTGSSSFELSQKTGEPLTGRHFTTTLLPLMQSEILLSNYEKTERLNDFLIFGSYPEILLHDSHDDKKRILDELVYSYLLKDVLVLDKIKSPTLLTDILRALAFQIGNEVSFSEIGKLVGRDTKTVQRYIDILEKTFVIKRVRGYSNNLRNEISKKSKFYFYDLGIRNAVINNYDDTKSRNDVGALWENFVFMELYKKSKATRDSQEFYFWRTHNGDEVDIITSKDGTLKAYECKWSPKASVSFKKILGAYPGTQTHVINNENYLDFLM